MTTMRIPKRVAVTGLVGAAVLGGTGIAALLNAGDSRLPVVEIQNAAASDTPSTTAAETAAAPERPARVPRQQLDEATLEKVKAAALEAVPGSSFDHGHQMMKTEGYKALVTKADGIRVLVTMDGNFKVTHVQDPAPARRPGGPRGDKSSLAAETVEKAKAAALEAVSDATFRHVHKLKDDEGYKVLLTKADGTRVVVTEDADFKVTKVEDPAPMPPRVRGGHRGGPGMGEGDGAPANTGTSA